MNGHASALRFIPERDVSLTPPTTAVGLIAGSKVTNRPLFFTASASRYGSVICLGPSSAEWMKTAVSVRLRSSGQN